MKKNLFTNICNNPYGHTKKFQLFDAAKNSKEFVQKLQLQRKIPVHAGCVNSICWNECGSHLLSGSDDQRLAVVNGYDYSVSAYVQTGHRANIFSAKFLPCSNDTHVISCSGDGIIIYSDLNRPNTSLDNKFMCHKGTAYEITTVPNDSNTFLSCGEDTTVRWFDLRTKISCSREDCKEDVLINCHAPVTALAINPQAPYQLSIGSADASVRIYDRRMLSTENTGLHAGNGLRALMTRFTVPEFEQSRRITSLCYSPDGLELLVSYSSDYIYLFDVKDDFQKSQKIFYKDTPSTSSDSLNGSGYRPMMKRLRIRGDWSDTGPNARPESEVRETTPSPVTQTTTNLVQTMTNILSRMFNTGNRNTRNTNNTPQEPNVESSEDENMHTDEEMEERPMPIFENPNEFNVLNNVVTSSNTDPLHLNDPNFIETVQQEMANDLPEIESMGGDAPLTITSAFSEERQSELSEVISEERERTPERDSNESVESSSTNKVTLNQPAELNESAPIESDSDNTDTVRMIAESMENRRLELIDRHHSEPMVNLHYSGQSVSSGTITMDVATSSTPNERQWLEQNMPDAIPESPSQQTSQIDEVNSSTTENQPTLNQPPSSDSETEAAVQSIQPNHNLPSTSDDGALLVSEARVTDNDNLQLMVEVDSCSWDSDGEEEYPTSARNRVYRRSRTKCKKHADAFMCSLNDKVKDTQKDDYFIPNITQPRVKRKYTGHRNARTMIKESTFWGDNFIMSGSDCGHIFIWDRYTTELVMLMEADHHVVNCLQPHPFDPILASSGIDYDIKLWAPTRDEPLFDVEKANEIIKRNEVMLEETKDTITVPASFMFRMFSSLSQFRTGRRWTRAARESRAARERENADSDAR